MVLRTQTIRRLFSTNCLCAFDHFVRLALKGFIPHQTSRMESFAPVFNMWYHIMWYQISDMFHQGFKYDSELSILKPYTECNQSSSVIRQKGEPQNGCFKKTKHAKFSEKRTFLTPWHAHVRKSLHCFGSARSNLRTTWSVFFHVSHVTRLCLYVNPGLDFWLSI